jgi:uncharacterized protein (DUF2062 family)
MIDTEQQEKHTIHQTRWYGPLQKAYERFLKIRGKPRDIALGFSVGLFIAMTPTIGFQMVIAIFFASLFKWNKISAAIGVWITNPITAPFIYSFSYFVGLKLYTPEQMYKLPAHIDSAGIYKILLKAPSLFTTLTIGGVVIGIPLAIIGYYLAHYLVNKYQEDIKAKLARQKLKRSEKKAEKKSGAKGEERVDIKAVDLTSNPHSHVNPQRSESKH